MQMRHRWAVCLGIALIGASETEKIEAQVTDMNAGTTGGPWYVRATVGPSFMENTRMSLDFSQPDAQVRFTPGGRLDVSGGYQVCRYFNVEGATGVIYNRIDSIAGSFDTDAGLAQIPITVRAVFLWPNTTRLVPFAGGGCGAVVDALDINHATIQGVSLHGNDSATAFAYEAFGGVRCHVNQSIDVSLAYEYLGSTQPEWDVNGVFPGTLVLRQPATHSVMAGVTIRF